MSRKFISRIFSVPQRITESNAFTTSTFSLVISVQCSLLSLLLMSLNNKNDNVSVHTSTPGIRMLKWKRKTIVNSCYRYNRLSNHTPVAILTQQNTHTLYLQYNNKNNNLSYNMHSVEEMLKQTWGQLQGGQRQVLDKKRTIWTFKKLLLCK